MFCPKCGEKIQGKKKICGKCGASLIKKTDLISKDYKSKTTKINQQTNHFLDKLKKVPKKYWIIGGAVVLAVILFFILNSQFYFFNKKEIKEENESIDFQTKGEESQDILTGIEVVQQEGVKGNKVKKMQYIYDGSGNVIKIKKVGEKIINQPKDKIAIKGTGSKEKILDTVKNKTNDYLKDIKDKNYENINNKTIYAYKDKNISKDDLKAAFEKTEYSLNSYESYNSEIKDEYDIKQDADVDTEKDLSIQKDNFMKVEKNDSYSKQKNFFYIKTPVKINEKYYFLPNGFDYNINLYSMFDLNKRQWKFLFWGPVKVVDINRNENATVEFMANDNLYGQEVTSNKEIKVAVEKAVYMNSKILAKNPRMIILNTDPGFFDEMSTSNYNKIDHNFNDAVKSPNRFIGGFDKTSVKNNDVLNFGKLTYFTVPAKGPEYEQAKQFFGASVAIMGSIFGTWDFKVKNDVALDGLKIW
jgi:hypothetical protein